MNGFLSDEVVTFYASGAAVAGTTAVNGTGYDLADSLGEQGFAAVRAIAILGALTATQVTGLKLQQSNDDGNTDAWADITGSATPAIPDSASSSLLITDVVRPAKRWVRPVLTRGTANAVLDGIILEVYRAARVPVTQDASVSGITELVGPN